MRVLLFTGNGGAGTTTCAAATAAHAAATGSKTLLVSLGAANSLADVCSVTLEREPTELAAGLYTARPGTQRAIDGDVQSVLGPVLAVLAGAGFDETELSSLPVLAELLVLLEVHSQVAAGRWDAIVIDCGPVNHAIATLTLPATLCRHLERLIPLPRKGVHGKSPASSAIPSPRAAKFFAAARLHARLRELRELLTDVGTTSVRLVVGPQGAAVSQARRSLTSLSLHGYDVDRIIANRVATDSRDSGRPDAELGQLQRLEHSFAPRPLVRLPHLQSEPAGVDTLRELGEVIYADEDPLAVAVSAPAVLVERRGPTFVLSLALPLAERRDIDLMRRDDELVVTVREQRRVILLPSALRRCVVTGAALVDGRLAVEFEPDPDLWLRS